LLNLSGLALSTASLFILQRSFACCRKIEFRSICNTPFYFFILHQERMMFMEMPIRAKPYTHQAEAYHFACRLFGLDGGDAVPISSRGVAYLMEMG